MHSPQQGDRLLGQISIKVSIKRGGMTLSTPEKTRDENVKGEIRMGSVTLMISS